MKNRTFGYVAAGLAAGVVNGLFGAGGGMVLVPLLSLLTDAEGQAVFSSSLAIILPVCLASLAVTGFCGNIPWSTALPYLFASAVGGWLAGAFGQKIPVIWLHRCLGGLIFWGGIRYLC